MLQSPNNAFMQPIMIQPVFSFKFAGLICSIHIFALSILIAIAYIHAETRIIMLGIGLIVVYSGWHIYWQMRHPKNILYTIASLLLYKK